MTDEMSIEEKLYWECHDFFKKELDSLKAEFEDKNNIVYAIRAVHTSNRAKRALYPYRCSEVYVKNSHVVVDRPEWAGDAVFERLINFELSADGWWVPDKEAGAFGKYVRSTPSRRAAAFPAFMGITRRGANALAEAVRRE